MRIFPGQLRPSFSIECGMCKRHSINGIADQITGSAKTKTEAKQILERAKWAFTRAWGWICPKCNQFGSAGVAPEVQAGRVGPWEREG